MDVPESAEQETCFIQIEALGPKKPGVDGIINLEQGKEDMMHKVEGTP